MQHLRTRGTAEPRRVPALAEPLEPRTLLAATTPDDGFAGELDLSFGADGVATDDRFGSATPYALARQPDGKLVVAGKTGSPFVSSTDILLLRFNADGSLDTAFGDNGRIVRDLGGPLDAIRGIVIDADGNILAGGVFHSPGGFADFFLARFTPAGELDTTFGEQGFVFTDFNRSDAMHALILQPDGKLLAAGTTAMHDPNQTVALARYLPDGSLDPEFGDGGKVMVPGLPRATANAVILHPDGRIVVGANTIEQFEHVGHALVLALNPDGSPDTDFGANGVVTYRPKVSSDSHDNLSVKNLAIDSHGRLLVASFGAGHIYLTRLLPDGEFDETYGDVSSLPYAPHLGRRFPVNPGVFNFKHAEAGYGFVLQPDDKPILAHTGQSFVGGSSPCNDIVTGPVRLLPDGQPDLSFGALGNGQRTKTRMLPPADMLILPDGDILSVGASTTGKIMLVRHHDGPAPLALDDQKIATFLGTPGDDDIELRTYTCGNVTTDHATVSLRRGKAEHLIVARRNVTPIAGFRILAGDGNDKITLSSEVAASDGRRANLADFLPVTVLAGNGDDHVTHGIDGPAAFNLDAADGNDRLTIHAWTNITISSAQLQRRSTTDYAGFEALDSTGNGAFTLIAPAPTIPIDITGNALVIGVLPAANVSFKPVPGQDTQLKVNAGTYFLPPDAPGFERTAISVGGTGRIEVGGSPTFRTLTLDRSGRIVTAPGNHVLTVAGSLSLSGGTLDLADNNLIYRPPSHLNPVNELTRFHSELFRTRFRLEGLWSGSGITSSTAAANRLTTLAVFLNPGLATFKGKPVGPSDIIFTHTWNGDANIDGRVNADDYFLIDQGFLGQNPSLTASTLPLASAATPRTARPTPDSSTRPTRKLRHIRPKQIYDLFA